jgi:hypothetical protein
MLPELIELFFIKTFETRLGCLLNNFSSGLLDVVIDTRCITSIIFYAAASFEEGAIIHYVELINTHRGF